MLNRLRIARLSAAVLAVVSSGSIVRAADLVWDIDPATAGPQDGAGTWDTTALRWYDGTNTVAWTNVGNNASFGNATNAYVGASAPIPIEFGSAIVVNDLAVGTAANGAYYNFSDFNGGSLAVNGNITKTTGGGGVQFLLNNGLSLSAGNHTIGVRDTPFDLVPELTFNSAINGVGASVTIDNASNYAGAAVDIQYGTTAFNVANGYTGGTNVVSGRLLVNDDNALGTGLVTISSAGQLAFAGAGTTVGDVTIGNAIKITRSEYATANTNNRYTDAISANNDGGTNTITLNGAFDVASTDARVAANTNRIVINSALTTSTGTGVLTLNGDFAGFVKLTADNTAYSAAGGSIKIIGGVELEASDEKNLGGPTSKLLLAGGTIRPLGTLGAPGSAFLTNFGAHDLSGAPVNTGLDLDATQTFVVNNLNGTAIGTRGAGTINFNGTNVFTGTPFFDGGVVNVNGSTTLGGFRLRSPVVNIGTGAVVTTTAGISDIGSDKPDNGTVNVTGNGQVNLASFDFYVGDNAGSATAVTTGTLNVSDSAVFTARGDQYYGRNAFTKGTLNVSGNAVYNNGVAGAFRALRIGNGNATASGFANVSGNGTINSNGELYVGRAGGVGVLTQSGGTINANQGGGNSFVVGGDNGSIGTFTKTGGATNVAGETWIGNAGAGTGTVTMSAGTFTGNSWFVVGRGGALGTLNLSGGTITKQGSDNAYIGESNNTNTSTMTVSGTGTYVGSTGEFWVGQGGGKGVLNIGTLAGQPSNADAAASFTTNNWLALGRANGASNGTINLYGGTLTKQGGNFLAIGSGGTGVLNQTGGTLNSSGTRLAEASAGSLNLSAGNSTFTGEFSLGYTGGAVGTLNVSGSANVVLPAVVIGVNSTTAANGGVLNLNGGTITATSFVGGASAAGSALRNFNFNGGTLLAASDQATFIGAKVNTVVSTGGAKIGPNAHAVTVVSALVHDGALGAAVDGGLTVSGTSGTLTVAGANTYTGASTVNGATLAFGRAAAAPAASSLAVNSGGTAVLGLQATSWAQGNVDAKYTQANLAIAAGGVLDLKNNYLTITAPTITKSVLKTMKADGRLVQTTGVSGRAVGYTTSGAGLAVAYSAIGDSNLSGDVNSSDISAVVLGGKYVGDGSGPDAFWDEGDWNGDGKASSADISSLVLAGTYNSGPYGGSSAPAGGAASLTSNLVVAGTSGNGVADIVYNVATGDLSFAKDGDARDIRELRIASASGAFKTANGSNVGFLDANTTTLQDRFSLSSAFGDGYDLGTLLASAGIGYNALSDLTVQYGVNGGGTLTSGSLVIVGGVAPEPASLVCLTAGVAGLFGRRRRRGV